MDSRSLLQEALALHQGGHFDEAALLYQRIPEEDTGYADALHLRGLIHYQAGDLELAVDLIRKAIAANPQQSVFHFNLGNVLRQIGEAAGAEQAYRTAIKLEPTGVDYHVNLGTLLEELGRPQEALARYRQAITLQPRDPALHCNMGNALRLLGLHEEAQLCYELALELDADSSAAHWALADIFSDGGRLEPALGHYAQAVRLTPDEPALQVDYGACLQRLGRHEEAAACYRQALAGDPGLAQAHNNLGGLYEARGALEAAAECYRSALTIAPDFPQAHQNYASTLEAMGDQRAAIHHYEEALRLKPDYAEAAYKLAALRGEAAPAAAPTEYVAALFDQYADEFDEHLTGILDYRAPQLLRSLCDELRIGSSLRVFDLGCGTGLSGAVFRDMAGHLAGVDLSARMIDKAPRELYDALSVGDITEALSATPSDWDVLIAADVFVYLGDLTGVFRAAHNALRPGGWLVFSVEKLEDKTGFTLGPSGRYAHSEGYVRALAGQEGLLVGAQRAAVLRKNHGQDVPGWLFALQRPA